MNNLIRAESIRVEFGSLVALRDVSFELQGGQLLGLVGPNGAGKTTLLRVLCGLHVPTHGMAWILNKPVLGEHEIVRHHVGFAPDNPPVYEDLTILQFLRFISGSYGILPNDTEERIDFWLEQLWLTEKRDTPIKHLSRGMRQRVTLARTFLPRPHAVLLDEPLAGLDPAGRIQLRRVLGMLRNQGCAMIVSSHILTDLEEVATHIAIIEQGSILRWSTTQSLHHEEESRRTYRLTVAGAHDGVCELLRTVDGVTGISCQAQTCTFDYHAGEDQAAELIKRMINEGVRLASFGSVKKTLEDAYLQAGVKQVD